MLQRLIIVALAVSMSACFTTRKGGRGLHLPDGDPEQGRADFVALACVYCHSVAGDRSVPPPTVDPPVPVIIGGKYTYGPSDGMLITSIVDPSYNLGPRHRRQLTTTGTISRMQSFGDVMTVTQLIDIVAYIQSCYDLTQHQPSDGSYLP